MADLKAGLTWPKFTAEYKKKHPTGTVPARSIAWEEYKKKHGIVAKISPKKSAGKKTSAKKGKKSPSKKSPKTPEERSPSAHSPQIKVAKIIINPAVPPENIVVKGVNISLPATLFTTVWIPNASPVSLAKDTPTMQKIGGRAPLFIANEEEDFVDDHWPDERDLIKGKGSHEDTNKLAFVAQFVDPRPGKKGNFVRVFIKNVNEIEGNGKKDALVQRLPLLDARQISILRPVDELPNTDIDNYDLPRQILQWRQTKEISLVRLSNHMSKLLGEAPALEMFDAVVKELKERDWLPYDGFKIGGFGESCQGIDYKYFIQNVYSGQYGDSGSLHIDEYGAVWGDMC